MTLELGVDFSQYGGELTRYTIDCWKQQGVKFAIVQYSALLKGHLEALEAAGGLDVDAYVYLYWGQDQWGQTPIKRTLNALNVCKGRVGRLWLDAEDTSHPYREDQLVECTQVCDQAGVPWGIYSGRWWWTLYGHNSAAFKDAPLWDARYLAESPIPDLAKQPQEMSFVQYGNWPAPTIWQWHNSTQLCGHSVDLNVRKVLATADQGGYQLSDAEKVELDLLRAVLPLRDGDLSLIRALVSGGPNGDGVYKAIPHGDNHVELFAVGAAGPEPFNPPVIIAV